MGLNYDDPTLMGEDFDPECLMCGERGTALVVAARSVCVFVCSQCADDIEGNPDSFASLLPSKILERLEGDEDEDHPWR